MAALRYSEALDYVGVDNDLFALGEWEPKSSLNLHSIQRTPLETLHSKALTIFQRNFIQRKSALLTPLSLEPKSIRRIFNDYDLIHFHSTYNILNRKGFQALLKSGKQTVITMHDQRWFTGGCHYSADCHNYRQGCNSCPQATKIGQFAVVNAFTKFQRILEAHPNLKIISPSQWLSEKAKVSKSLNNSNIRIIRNPIPNLDAQILNKENSNHVYSSDSMKRLVFIADNLQNPLKGLDVLVKALNSLDKSEIKNYELSLIGNNPPNTHLYPLNTRILNIDETHELTRYMREQDVLIVPSRQDNLPNVIGEAFSAGVKVIGANIGGIPEVINSEVGALFQSENHLDLADKLRNFEYKYSREKITNHFENVFSYGKIGQQIVEFYYE